MTFSLSQHFSRWPQCCSSTSISACTPLTLCALPLSPSATAHPALWYPLYLSGEAHVHCLCGVIWGHAHTHHLAQRWPAHCSRFCLWRRNRNQRVHELPANLQGDTEAQWKLHLHRQQRRCHRQLGKTADCYWWGIERGENSIWIIICDI